MKRIYSLKEHLFYPKCTFYLYSFLFLCCEDATFRDSESNAPTRIKVLRFQSMQNQLSRDFLSVL